MASFESDFILRAVQQLARLMQRALKLKEEKQYDKAEQALAEGYLEIFGIDPRFFPLMDAKTVAASLGHREKVAAFAELLRHQAELAELQGEAQRAALLRTRAGELLAASDAG